MKKLPASLVVALIAMFSCPTLDARVRDWTRAADGKKISAEFAGMKDESTVKIKLGNGQIYEVPLSGLSPEDGAYIKEAVAKEGGAMKPAAGSAATTPAPAVPEGAVTITLSGVHLCCKDCEDAVLKIPANEKAPIPAGVTLTPDRKEGTIVIAAPSGKDAQAALRGVIAAGFYGKSDNEAVKIADLKPDEFTASTMVLRDVHLCCGGCVKALAKAVESVDGVKSQDAKTGSTRVTVTGEDFKTYEVMQALREAGFGGSFQ
jgi:copper chaperone CopZ